MSESLEEKVLLTSLKSSHLHNKMVNLELYYRQKNPTVANYMNLTLSIHLLVSYYNLL